MRTCIKGFTAIYAGGLEVRQCYGPRAEAVIFWADRLALSPSQRTDLYLRLSPSTDHVRALVEAGRLVR